MALPFVLGLGTAAWLAAEVRIADVAVWAAVVAGELREVLDGTPERGALSGSARIIDGDTLEVGGKRVRLYGIDAPESAQRCLASGQMWSCGLAATRSLAGRIGSRAVSCEERNRDRYGRIVAVCHAGGEDLNGWMVSEGWAMAYRRYSMRYAPDDLAAKEMGRGIWRGEVVAPWNWRRDERLTSSAAPGDGGRVLELFTAVVSGDPDPPGLSWTTILGGVGNLRAAVTDGASQWWVAATPEGSDPLVTMTLRVKGLVRNAERQAGLDMRMTSWVLPAELVDQIAAAAETQDMSPSEWAAGVLEQAFGRRSEGE